MKKTLLLNRKRHTIHFYLQIWTPTILFVFDGNKTKIGIIPQDLASVSVLLIDHPHARNRMNCTVPAYIYIQTHVCTVSSYRLILFIHKHHMTQLLCRTACLCCLRVRFSANFSSRGFVYKQEKQLLLVLFTFMIDQ